jgi:hypothetical protein
LVEIIRAIGRIRAEKCETDIIWKVKIPSKESIKKRNERINGKKNAESLKFMAYVKSVSDKELLSQYFYAKGWERVAIERELRRREEKEI